MIIESAISAAIGAFGYFLTGIFRAGGMARDVKDMKDNMVTQESMENAILKFGAIVSEKYLLKVDAEAMYERRKTNGRIGHNSW